MVDRGGIRVGSTNRPKSIIAGKISGMEQNFEIHHIVDNDLDSMRHDVKYFQQDIILTWKSGSGASQLLVHPTMGSKRFASSLAKLFIAVIAV